MTAVLKAGGGFAALDPNGVDVADAAKPPKAGVGAAVVTAGAPNVGALVDVDEKPPKAGVEVEVTAGCPKLIEGVELLLPKPSVAPLEVVVATAVLEVAPKTNDGGAGAAVMAAVGASLGFAT